MPAEWMRIESERLPRQVFYLNDGLKRVQRGGVSVVEPWPPPYDRGFKHAVYEAMEGTNLNGVFIPTTWTFTRNGLRPDGSGGLRLGIVTRTEVRAATVTDGSGAAFSTPGYTGIVRMVDYRFASSSPPVPQIWYRATNGVWPDESEAARAYRNQVRMREKLAASGEAAQIPSRRRWVALTLLALAAIGPVIFVTYRAARNRVD